MKAMGKKEKLSDERIDKILCRARGNKDKTELEKAADDLSALIENCANALLAQKNKAAGEPDSAEVVCLQNLVNFLINCQKNMLLEKGGRAYPQAMVAPFQKVKETFCTWRTLPISQHPQHLVRRQKKLRLPLHSVFFRQDQALMLKQRFKLFMRWCKTGLSWWSLTGKRLSQT